MYAKNDYKCRGSTSNFWDTLFLVRLWHGENSDCVSLQLPSLPGMVPYAFCQINGRPPLFLFSIPHAKAIEATEINSIRSVSIIYFLFFSFLFDFCYIRKILNMPRNMVLDFRIWEFETSKFTIWIKCLTEELNSEVWK